MHLTRLHIFILLPIILVPWSLGYSQDSSSQSPPPPTPPYVGTLSGDFTFLKKITYLAQPQDSNLTDAQKAAQNFLSPPSTKIQELNAVQTGSIRRDTEVFVDGTSREIWRQQTFRFTVYLAHPDSVTISFATDSKNVYSPTYYKDSPDFPELDWIKDGMFQGVQMLQGKQCYTYKFDDRTAWIDVSTRLPLDFESKARQVSYTYSRPPDEPLQLPKGFAEKLQKVKRAWMGQN